MKTIPTEELKEETVQTDPVIQPTEEVQEIQSEQLLSPANPETSSDPIETQVAVVQSIDIMEPAKTEPVKVEELVKEVTPESIQAPVIPEGLSERQTILFEMENSGTQAQKNIIGSLKAWVETVKPRVQMNPAVAAKAEYELLIAFKSILDLEYDEFKLAWSTLLLFFAEHHGENNNSGSYSALSEYNMMRYLDHWTKGSDAARAYGHLVHVIRSTRHSAGRKAAAGGIVFDAVGRGYLSEANLDNLKKYYKV